MARKASLTEKEIDELAELAVGNPGEKAETILALYNRSSLRPISLSTVQKKLAEWRKNGKIPPANAALPKEERDLGLEAPWSLGLLANPKYEIAQTAVDSLMEVWRYSLAVGHVLTIREALWAARLAKVFAQRKQTINYSFVESRAYARRQQVCELLNKPMDTRGLDAGLGMDPNEGIFYKLLGIIPFSRELEKVELEPHSRDADRPRHWLKSAPRTVLANINPELFYALHDELNTPNAYMNDLSEKQEYIYAAILVFLSKGPKWSTLSNQETLSLLSQIRQCAIRSTKTMFPRKPDEEILDTDLLNIVGYELTPKTKPWRLFYERIHPSEK
jgi:hypothetical protein